MTTFAEQLRFKPEIENKSFLPHNPDKIIVGGMGGSGLATGLLSMVDPSFPLMSHQTYGLPAATTYENVLYIASSYSGNTEETLDFARSVKEEGKPLAILAAGGELLRFAKEHSLPFIKIPETGIQPREALGYSLVSLSHMLGVGGLLFDEIAEELTHWNAGAEEEELIEACKDRAVLVVTTHQDAALGYVWKVMFNETAKVPSFSSVVPELNHNEMEALLSTKLDPLVRSSFHFIFLTRNDLDVRVQKRFRYTKELYQSAGYSVSEVELSGTTLLKKILFSLAKLEYVVKGLAEYYGVNPTEVAVIEEFKKKLKE